MGIDILIVDTPMDRLVKLSRLFKDHCYWHSYDNNILLIMQSLTFNDSLTNLSIGVSAIRIYIPMRTSKGYSLCYIPISMLAKNNLNNFEQIF
jgi:hypothetical protein